MRSLDSCACVRDGWLYVPCIRLFVLSSLVVNEFRYKQATHRVAAAACIKHLIVELLDVIVRPLQTARHSIYFVDIKSHTQKYICRYQISHRSSIVYGLGDARNTTIFVESPAR